MVRILLVDDEKPMRKIIRLLLRDEGYEVFDVASGMAALKKIKEDEPDLILLDIMMPGMSGIEVLREVKEKHPKIDVIMVTAYGNLERAVESLRLGAYDFIQKPINQKNFIASIHRCLEKRRLNEELNQLKELNERIVKQMNESIFVQNLEGTITFANPQAEDLLGYGEGTLIGIHWSKLVTPGDMKKVEETIKKGRAGKQERYECVFLGKDGREIPTLCTISPLTDNEGFTNLLCAFIDITERKKAEEKMKRKILKHKVENGNIYLVKNKEIDKAVEVFLELLDIGYKGIVITRSHPEKIREKVKDNTGVIWITEEESPGRALPPKIYAIDREIRDFIARDKVVLLDRLDYLIAKLGFEKVLKLVQNLNELFYIQKGVLILSIDPDTLPPPQLSLLEKETQELELRIKHGISEELYEIIEYIHTENKAGKTPYHRDVAEKFNITKVTVVKRLKLLKTMGLIMSRQKGRYKALELTEDGKAVI